jgi:tetratricopeptide (TPR) repeat protein
MVVPEARAALLRALELQPDRAMSLNALGGSYMTADHDWICAEQYLRRSSQLDPAASAGYGFWLSAHGRSDEAIEWINQALLRDPANAHTIADAGRMYHFARSYKRAVVLFQKALELVACL